MTFLAIRLLVCVVLLGGSMATAEEQLRNYRVVIEISGEGEEHWSGLVTNLINLQSTLGADQTLIEVVVHGKALPMLVGKNKAVAEPFEKLSRTGVRFVACEKAMAKQGVSREELLPFATTVDAGIAEVVRKQEAGWTYVRLDH